ncbi:MAG: hypothetical protein EB082_15870, partial [Verrucomicrobia bacterium]|nr:hypothetical protein [Verrucomicrobiota bacterium]
MVDQPARLDEITARLTLRTQVLGDVQSHRLAGLDQRIAEQHGRLAAKQFGLWQAGVAHPEGKILVLAEGGDIRRGCNLDRLQTRWPTSQQRSRQPGETLPKSS